jgi:hypothetical protein
LSGALRFAVIRRHDRESVAKVGRDIMEALPFRPPLHGRHFLSGGFWLFVARHGALYSHE